MNIKRFLINIGKGILIFIFVVFVFMPFSNFWVEHPLLAGTLIMILYFISEWAKEHILYFKKRRDKERKDKDNFI